MRKKFLSIILILLIILPVFEPIVLANTDNIINVGNSIQNYNDFGYVIIENQVQIVDYYGDEANIIIPETIEGYAVTSMDSFSSKDCYENIITMQIPASMVNINNNIFFGLKKLENIIVDENNPKYFCENGILYNKEKTEIVKYLAGKNETEYTVPSGIKKIGERAFLECTMLNQIIIEDGLEKIDALAFCGCVLDRLEIPNSVNTISENAFDCSLVTIYGEKDSYIETYAQAHNITFVDINAEEPEPEDVDFEYYESSDSITINRYIGNSENIVIPERINGKLVTQIVLGTFITVNGITSISIPSGVNKIDNYTFKVINSLENITVDENNQTYSSEDGVLFNKDKTELIVFPSGKKIDRYVIPDGVTKIDRYSFDEASNVKTIVIPQSVYNIVTIAFNNLSGLQEFIVDENNQTYSSEDGILFSKDKKKIVKYPSGKQGTEYIISPEIETIGENAFEYCQNLEEIFISDGVKKIENWAFSKCVALQKLTISYTVTEIGLNDPFSSSNENFIVYVYNYSDAHKFVQQMNINYEIIEEEDYSNFTYIVEDNEVTIKAYKGNEAIVKIPSKIKRMPVTKIGISAFGCCYDVEEVIIPDSVTEIGDSAFGLCYNLKRINIPEGMVKIDASAFRDCHNLENLQLPDSITEIGQYAFYGCKKFTNILLPPNITQIKESTYANCVGLTEIVIPERITQMGKYAFFCCTNLKKVTLPDGLKDIDDLAFDTSLNYIDDLTIYGYTNSYSEDYAQRLHFKFESIGISTTRFLVTFKDYDGTVLSVQKVEKGCSAVAPERPTREGYTFEYWDKSFDNITESIEITAVYSENKFDYILYNDEITITKYLEYGNDVTIPEKIGGYPVVGIAGLGQTLIETLYLPSTVRYISETVLVKDCIDLEEINVDSENQTFSSENGILYNKDKTAIVQYPRAKKGEEYVFLDSINKVNNYAFVYCGNLKRIIVNDEVTEIGTDAFSYCNNLTEIKLSKKINIISKNAFYNCISLESIDIPDGVSEIGMSCFGKCEKLKSIVLPESITSLGSNLFSECTNLESVVLPNNIEEMPQSIFAYCNSLNNVHFPDNLKKLKTYSFNKWTGVRNIVLPDGLEEIGSYAFRDCKNLESVYIPDTVTTMGDWSFYNCENLYDLKLSSNVKVLSGFFYNCNSITDITIPDGVEEIRGAFASIKYLTSITIPRSVFYIYENAFYDKDILTIYGEKNSYAEVYAKYNNIKFKLISEKDEIKDIDITPCMFNSQYYADVNIDVKQAFGYDEEKLKNHYLNYGIDEGRKASPIFDAEYYKNKYSDLSQLSNRGLYNHFIKYGIKEGRQASLYFNVVFYNDVNDDARKAFKNNYTHCANHFYNNGIQEGRQGSKEFNVIDFYNNCTNFEKNQLGKDYLKYYAYSQQPSVIENNPINITEYMFDAELYFNLYGDLQQAIGNDELKLKEHYLNFGIKEGRIASYVFDARYYIENNEDIRNAYGSNYLEVYNHFVNYGINEGRDASRYFNAKYYIEQNEDIENAFGNNYSKALEHFVNYGINEGRTSSDKFNVNVYREQNEDLEIAFGNNWRAYYMHYVMWGINEGRICV